jgi:hypothetical protein
MKETIFRKNIEDMFERYYRDIKNVKNDPLYDKKGYNAFKTKLPNADEELYKKYKYIKERMKEINNKFDEFLYISREINSTCLEPTKILKKEIEKTSFFDFENKFEKEIEEVEYFYPMFRYQEMVFELDLEDPFLRELENALVDMLHIKNSILKKETKKNEKKLKKLIEKYEELLEEQKTHDKKILEIMGIFLSIFSVIGLGVTGILNIQDNLSTNILLIMGSILIVVTLLFALIKYDSENKYKFWILIIFGINLILTGIFFYNPVDKNWEETKIKIENLEKKLDYEKRINELEKKTK